MVYISKRSTMERSANKAAKQDGVTSPAEETVQFDDDNLRGEKWKYHILSVIKYQWQRNFTRLVTN